MDVLPLPLLWADSLSYSPLGGLDPLLPLIHDDPISLRVHALLLPLQCLFGIPRNMEMTLFRVLLCYSAKFFTVQYREIPRNTILVRIYGISYTFKWKFKYSTNNKKSLKLVLYFVVNTVNKQLKKKLNKSTKGMVYATKFHGIQYRFVYTESRIPSNVVCANCLKNKSIKKN